MSVSNIKEKEKTFMLKHGSFGDVIGQTVNPLGSHAINASSRVRALLLFLCAALGFTCNVFAQRTGGSMSNEARQFVGTWSGTRTERNPITGRAYTVNFDFQFRSDGTYT